MRRFTLAIFTIFALFALPALANDALIRDAADAYKRRDETKLIAITTQTRGHPLEAYPQYWAARLRLDDLPAAQIESFSKQFAGALAQQLRMEWLNDQAKREQWSAWTGMSEAALAITADNGDFQCNRAHWQLRNGKTPEAAPTALWNERLTEACALAFVAYAKANLVSADDVRLRFRLAADGATLYAATEIANLLPASARPSEDTLARAHGNATRALTKPTINAQTKEALLFALGRLARQDVEVADEAWRKISAQFSAEEKSWAHLQLGVYAARQHQSDAMRFFAQVADVRVSDPQAAWWVRAALRAGDWKEVLRATDAMSETGRSENTWTYWRGRALAAAGKSELATAEYDRIKNGFGFYNWLAAEELKSAPQVLGNTVEPSAAQLAFFESNAGAQRAVALSKINLRFEAAREWNFILKDLPDAELAAASAWMQRKNVWDRSVSAAVRIKAQHDLSKRYVVPFSEALFGAAKDHGLEPALVAGLTRQESQFAPDVVSSAGAIGLMQLMPNTAKWVAKKMSRTYDRAALEDPATNAQFGAFYLRTVMDGLAGSPVLGLAAYNAGPGRAKNWQASKPLEGAIYAENILFNETRDYVKQVLVNAMWIDRVHAGGKGPSLKARLGLIPARGGSMTLAKDTP